MNSIGTLVGVRFIGAQKPLVHALGLNAAVFLNECLYWQGKVGIGNWFNRTIPQFTEDTGLSKHEQKTVRDYLLERGLIEEQKGVQYRTQTRVNIEAFNDFLTEIQPTETVRLADENCPAETSQPTENRRLADRKPSAHITGNNNDNSKELNESALSSDRIKPYSVWIAYCEGRQIPTDHLTGKQLERQLHTARLIVNDGISVDDVKACSSWLQSQDWWRNKGFDLGAIRSQYARWVALNKPKAERPTGAKKIRGATPNI